MTELVNSATWTSDLHAESFVQGADAMKQAANDAATALEHLDEKTTKAGKDTASSADAFQRWLARIDPATRAGQQYTQMHETLSRFQAAGVVSASDLAIAETALKSKFEEGAAAVEHHGLMSEFAAEAMRPLLALLTVEKLVEFSRSTLEMAASLQTQAAIVGVSVEALQVYREQMEEVGLSNETADMVIRKLTKGIGEAAAGPNEFRKAFIDLGITAEDLAGGTQGVLPKVAEALLNVGNEAERARLELAIFGRSGQDLNPALEKLAEGYDNAADHAKALGLVISDDLAKKALAATREFDEAWKKLEVSAVPAVTAITAALADLISKMGYLATHPLTLINPFARFPVANEDAADSGATSYFPGISIGKPTNAAGLLGGGFAIKSGNTGALGYNAPDLDKFLDKQRIAAALAGETAAQRAVDQALIDAAGEKLKDTGGTQNQIVRSVEDARRILGDVVSKEVERNALAITGAKAEKDRANDFERYLGDLRQEAATAALTSLERDRQQTMIKAAQAYQREYNVDAKHLVSTYEDAVRLLGDQNKALVDAAFAAAHLQQVMQSVATSAGAVGKALGLPTQMRNGGDLTGLDPNGRTEARAAQLRGDYALRQSTMNDTKKDWTDFLHQADDAQAKFFKNFLTTGHLSFKSLASDLLSAWADVLVKMEERWIESQIFGGMTGMGGGTGGLFSLFGGGGGIAQAAKGASSFLGLFDDGGTIGPGQWGIKSGIPEIIQGGTFGVSVKPVANFAANDAGSSAVIHFNIDARGSQMSEEQFVRIIHREVTPMLGETVRVASSVAVGAVSNKLNNSGRGKLG